MKRPIIYSLISLIMLISVVLFVSDNPVKKTSRLKSDMKTSAGWSAYLFEQKKIKKTKPKFDKPDQAFEEMITLRTEIGKSYNYPDNWRFLAYEEAKRGDFALRKPIALNWVERGPGNIGGRTRSIVVHPDDTNIWWVGAVGGGVWKTTDGGTTWDAVGEDMPVLSVCALDICQTNPDVLYAGTGEGFWNYDGIIGDGVFITTDGGDTWTQLTSTASDYRFRYVNRLIVDPDDDDIVLAATNTGVYRSTDGGDNWTTVYSDDDATRVQQIIANPQNFNTQFIAVNQENNADTPGGIYKSVDGGQSWTKVSEEIPVHARIELAIAPSDTNVVYAAVESNAAVLGLYRSTDAGETWVDYGGDDVNWLGGQGWYDNTLCVNPLDENIVFLGGINLYRATTNDTAATYDKLTHWYSGTGYPYVHADQHFLVTIQTSPTVFSVIAANDGGIHASYDNGINWTELNNGYNVTQYYDADMSPSAYEFIGGTQDNGTHRSPNLPDAVSPWTGVIGGDGFDCAWDKFNPLNVYGTLYNTRVWKSTDGGYTFTELSGLPQSEIFHTPLAMNPDNSDNLFTMGIDNKVWYTENGGSSWDSVSIETWPTSRGKISISQSNSNIVWAGNTSRYLNVSVNGGASFIKVADNPDLNAYLIGLATHPAKDSTAFMTLGVSGYGKVFRTEDLGQTWENITNNLPNVPVLCLLIMPYDANIIWIGTDIGLFVSTDNGQIWTYQNEGMPAVAVHRLKIVGQNVVAATHGRGIWSVFIPELSTGPLLAPVIDDITVPNPNTGDLKINFFASADYDSIQVIVNNNIVDRLLNIPASKDTFGVYLTVPPQAVTAKIIGYYDEESVESSEKSQNILAAVNLLTENFDSGTSDFFGDFSVGAESGFTTPLLNSEHPYSNAANHLAYLGTPVNVLTGTSLSFNDVAIVEPGEIGSAYPDEEFWDYVTVEGSNDGDTWDVLLTPYDAGYHNDWLSAYNSESDGEESMFQLHLIDLTNHYTIGQAVYLRFRLFADAYANGWGWAIDDIEISNSASDINGGANRLMTFELIGNYPNPFNPATTIRFTLDKSQAVSLHIYNNLGQLVTTIYNNTMLETGVMHLVKWNGINDSGNKVATGLYYYRLKAGNNVAVKRMLLVR